MSGLVGGDVKVCRMAEKHTILRALVGSEAHGLAQKGSSDRDEKGVVVEPLEAFGGLFPFEQYEYRTAAERTGKHDAPSEPGDLDLTLYSLKKFLRLAMQGNPDILMLLFVQENCSITPVGRGLQSLAPAIVSRAAGKRYLGYMESQRQRLLGERGQKKVNRPELEERFGYDTKYATHIIRLGMQGVELLTTGRLSLPMPEADRTWCLGVRNGEASLQDVLQKAGELEREVKDLIEESPLPAEPNREVVEQWMLDTYWDAWAHQRRALA